MEPQYSRDRVIDVYSARSADPASSLVVGVRDGLVTLSMDMHWSCRPQDVDKLAAALADAKQLAAQWTERDERIARLMDLRAENAQIWWTGLEKLIRQWKGALLDERTIDEIRSEVEAFRAAKITELRTQEKLPPHLRVVPPFVIGITHDGTLLIEPCWQTVTLLRWVE